ncbi:MAG: membrane dipeptidase [Micavibrio sp.]|nr:membrane dipeptidase [Micavibrio sp.]
MTAAITYSRRKFLGVMAGTGAALMLPPLAAFAAENTLDARTTALVAATFGIDTHNHIDVPLSVEDGPAPDLDLADEMKKSGLSAISMTFAVDYHSLKNPGEAYSRFTSGLDGMDAQLQKNGMTRALTLADLRAAKKNNQPIVVQSVEGAHFLEGKIERVKEAYNRGLRHFGLLHDSDASTPLGDVYTNPPRFNGLTDFGTAVIKECNRLGMLVDLAHVSDDTVIAALKVAEHPVIISHTGLNWRLGSNENMARMMRPRLISKELAKTVAAAGGVVGVWTHLADSPLEYAQNLHALAELIGPDHVCIGTDTKLTPPLGPHMPRPGERTNTAWESMAGMKTGFFTAVVDAMLKTGFAPTDIAKIGGENFCRVFGAATQKTP